MILFFKASLKNTFVSPYPNLFYRSGLVGWKVIFLTSKIEYPSNLIIYSKTCLEATQQNTEKLFVFSRLNIA